MAIIISPAYSLSLNYHLTSACNMKCKGCFSHLAPYKKKKLSLEEGFDILRNLNRVSTGYARRKITFSGGEPLLIEFLPELIDLAKSYDFTTNVVTNGYLVTEKWIERVRRSLDWLSVSVDSPFEDTNIQLGRTVLKKPFPNSQYGRIIAFAKNAGLRVKINTVVSKVNVNEDFSELIGALAPARWKVMQTLILENENRSFFLNAPTDDEFRAFVERHTTLSPIVETSSSMIDSYAMVGPDGRVYGNTGGRIAYQRKVSEMSITEFSQWYEIIRPKIALRGGEYDWEREVPRKTVPKHMRVKASRVYSEFANIT